MLTCWSATGSTRSWACRGGGRRTSTAQQTRRARDSGWPRASPPSRPRRRWRSARVHRGAALALGGLPRLEAPAGRGARLRAETVALACGSCARKRSRSECAAPGTWRRSASGSPSGRSGPRSWRGTDGFTRGLRSIGARHGAERLAAVIVTSGVVGRVAVFAASPPSCRSSPTPRRASAASCCGRAPGLVEGVAGGRLRIKVAVSEEAFQPGDLVVTWGSGAGSQGAAARRVLRAYSRPGSSGPPARARCRSDERRGSPPAFPRGAGGNLGPAFPES